MPKHKPWALLFTSHRMQCAVTGFLSQSECSNVVNLLLQAVSGNVIGVLLLKSHQSSFWWKDTALSPMLFRTLVDGVILLLPWLATLAVVSTMQKMPGKALN